MSGRSNVAASSTTSPSSSVRFPPSEPIPSLMSQLSHATSHRAAAALHSSTRSEEHTSDLQSLMRTSYAAFCLKKKRPFIRAQCTYHYRKQCPHSSCIYQIQLTTKKVKQ